jgi:hypothetical protein
MSTDENCVCSIENGIMLTKLVLCIRSIVRPPHHQPPPLSIQSSSPPTPDCLLFSVRSLRRDRVLTPQAVSSSMSMHIPKRRYELMKTGRRTVPSKHPQPQQPWQLHHLNALKCAGRCRTPPVSPANTCLPTRLSRPHCNHQLKQQHQSRDEPHTRIVFLRLQTRCSVSIWGLGLTRPQHRHPRTSMAMRYRY